MTVKLGINGFGRIGRGCIRASFDYEDVEVVAINSTRDPNFLAHLLKYDSVYGIFDREVKAEGQSLVIDGKRIAILADRDPSNLDWASCGAEVIIEATGSFRKREEAAKHLEGGGRRVIITAPGKGVDFTVVMGVNEAKYDPQQHVVLSNASCTTNCLAPVVKVLHEQFGLVKGMMTTVHAYTNDQRILDLTHKDFRRARAAGLSIIPTTTGAAQAVSQVIPEMKGKIDGFAVRVPTPTVSLVDLVAELEKRVSPADINLAFKEAADGPLNGILGVCEEPLVSVDFKGNSLSSVVDALSTMVVGDNLAKVLAWYDNEWAYCCRTLELAAYLKKQGI